MLYINILAGKAKNLILKCSLENRNFGNAFVLSFVSLFRHETKIFMK